MRRSGSVSASWVHRVVRASSRALVALVASTVGVLGLALPAAAASVSSVSFLVPPYPQGTGTPASANSAYANQPTVWAVQFTATTANPASATVTFPAGFTIATSPTFTLSGAFSCTTYTGTASASGTTITVTMPGCALASGAQGTITFNTGITNPPVTDLAYTSGNFSVTTSTDVNAAIATAIPALTYSGSSIISPSVAGATNKAHATEPWTVQFTTSNITSSLSAAGPYGGALVAGDTISVTFPAGFVLPATPTITLIASGFGNSCTASGSTSGQTVLVTLAGTCTLGNLKPASLTIDGVTNPIAGSYSFAVHTSEDPSAVPANAVIAPAGTAVTHVTFSPITYAGNAATTWTANFTPTSPGELTAGDTISVTMPSSFTLSSPTTVTFAAGFVGGTSCASESVTPSSGTLVVTVPAGCSLPGGLPAGLSFSATNPPATSLYATSQFAIATSEDPTSVNPTSVTAITPSGSQVSAVTFAGATNKANVTETWTVGFTTSSTGALAAGDTITAAFPAGFAIGSSPTVTFLAGFTGCAPATGVVNGTAVTVALPSGCSLGASKGATISFPVTNPTAGTYAASGFSVHTSEDPTSVSPTSNVVILSTVSTVTGVTFTGSPSSANTLSTWTVGFTTSSSGALSAGGTISVTFPAGFVLPATPTITLIGTDFGAACTASASTTGQTVLITLAGTCTLGNLRGALLTIGVTNPPVTDPSYAASNFSVFTSSDAVPANPSSVAALTASGSSVASGSVSFAGATNKGNVTETWTVHFTPSSTGALVAGDTVTVTFPSSFAITPNPSIGLTSGFFDCLAFPTVTGSTLNLTLYNNGGTCSLGGGAPATLTITSVTNPPAGTYAAGGFSVATSEDPTPVHPTSAIVIGPSGTAVSAVRFTAISYAANTSTTWTVGFTPSVPGNLVAGDSVTAVFPVTGGASDFTIGATPSVTFASTFNGGVNCSPTAGTFTSATGTLVVVLPAGCSLAGGYAATLSVAAVNPSATTSYSASQFSVHTSEDPTPVSPTSVGAVGASGSAVTGVNFAVAQYPQASTPSFSSGNAAYGNQSSLWQVTFTASGSGGLIAGDHVTVTFAPGFDMTNPTVVFGGSFSSCTNVPGVANGPSVTVTLPTNCTLASGLTGMLTLESVTNPPATATFSANQFSVSTSEDLTAVSPQVGQYVSAIVPSGSTPSVTTGFVTDSPATSNVSATLTVNFTTSPLGPLTGAGPYGGGLTPGDTVTVAVPAGFVVTTPSTAVTLSGCPAATTGAVTGTVGSGWMVTLRIPAGCSIGNGTSATLTIAVTNPPASTYTGFSVATSEDPTANGSSYSVHILPSGTVVSAVTFGALSYAGNTATTWTVGFTPSLPGALAGGDTITVTMPSAFFPAIPAQLVTFASGFAGGASCAPVAPGYASSGGSESVTATLPAGCSLAGGQPATITIALINPPSTFLYATSQFGVKTSADGNASVAPASVHAIVPSGSQVHGVSLSATTYSGNQTSTWTATFTTSTVGAPIGSHGGALVAGDTIAVSFPAGFVIAPAPAATLSSCAGLLSGVAAGSVDVGWTVTLTLPTGCAVASSTSATVTIQVTNPPVTNHYAPSAFAVSTSEDPQAATPLTVSPLVASGSHVGSVTFAGATNKANVTETWTVDFTPSSLGGLVAGDTLSATFPTTFGLVSSPSIGLNANFGTSCTAAGSVTGHTLTVTLLGTCSLANGQATSFTVSSVTNPPAGTNYVGFAVATSEDPSLIAATNEPITIAPTGGQVSAVTFTAGTYAGNISTTWTAGFTASTGGDLYPGDTVTVKFPTANGTSVFLITPTPTVNFTAGFVAGFLGCNPTVGAFAAATGTLTVTLPANCTLAAGVSASISVTAVNPPVTTTYLTSQFSVATNEDFTPASPLAVHPIVPSGSSVTGVSFSASSYLGNQTATWTVQFSASNVGAQPPFGGELVTGDTITVLFPSTFSALANPTLTLGGTPCALGANYVIAYSRVMITLPSGCTLATGAQATLTLSAVNPPVTEQPGPNAYFAWTSEDPMMSVASASPLTSTGKLIVGALAPTNTRANQTTPWTFAFSTGATGSLVATDTITAVFPATLTASASPPVTLTGFVGSCTILANDVLVTGSYNGSAATVVTVTLPKGCSYGSPGVAGSGGSISITLTNPPYPIYVAAGYTASGFDLFSSENPGVANPSSVSALVRSGTAAQNVTFSALSYGGNQSTIWSATFTTENALAVVGGLQPGDTITVTFPTKTPSPFIMGPASAISLSGFGSSCALGASDVGIAGMVVTITLPAGCSIANGATGSVNVALTNPPVTEQPLASAFSLYTSEENTSVSPSTVSGSSTSPLVPGGVSTSSVSFVGYSNSSNTVTLWTLGFVSSPTGQLVASDWVKAVFAPGFVIANPTTVTFTTGFVGCTTTSATFSANTLYFTLPVGCSLPASTIASFTLTATNPIIPGQYPPTDFSIATSENPTATNPISVVVVGGISSTTGGGSGPGTGTTGTGTTTSGTGTTSTPAPPPTGIAPSDLGTPQSTVVGTTATSILLVSGSSIFELTVPASSLPAGTTVSLYPVTTTSSLKSQVPAGGSFIVALAISWQTAGGATPASAVPLTLTVSDPGIVTGDVVYVVTATGLTGVGVATSNDTVTINFSSDPVFVVATASPLTQSALAVNPASALVGQSLTMTSTGGSGAGTVTFAVTGGTATGCSINGSTLRASGAGTCVVVATKAADATYASTSSAPTTFTFKARVIVHPIPPALTLRFGITNANLTPAMRAALAVLAHKLVRGASVVIMGFGFHNVALARARALGVRKFLLSRVSVRVALRFVTSARAPFARVITTRQ